MWWLLADLLLHSALIVLAAEFACLLARRMSPASRHHLRLLGFALVLVWPLLALLVPQWQWAWFSPRAASEVTTDNLALGPGVGLPSHSTLPWMVWVWLAGVSAYAAYFAVGYVMVSRVARRAVALNGPEWISLLEEMGESVRPQLLKAAGVVTPFVFGYRSKWILLPPDCDTWTTSVRRSVLAHEVAHIKRHDMETQLFAQTVAALWWFQPLLAISLRSIRRDSEFASDRLVLETGATASDYAADLLNIASKLGDRRSMMAAAIPMARTNLAARVGAVLTSPLERQSRRTPLLCAAALAATALAASALSINEVQNVRSLGGTMIRRLVPSALAMSAGLSAASIAGALLSSKGVAVASATTTLVNSGAQLRQQLESDTSGKFTFQGLPAGQYTLRVDKPGFASLSREFAVAENAHIDREFIMSADAKQQTSRPEFVRIGGNVAHANLVKQVQPTYPPEAKAAHLQGQVVLETMISEEGVPQNIRLISSPSDEMTQSALEAVRQWRYRPTLLNGQPIQVLTEVHVNYTLAQ